MKCDVCGGEAGNSKFCPHCGAPCHPGADMVPTVRECPRCGNLYDSRFCPDCGHSVLEAAEAGAMPQVVVRERTDVAAFAPSQVVVRGAQSAQAAPPTIVINNMVESVSHSQAVSAASNQTTNANVNTNENTNANVGGGSPAPAVAYPQTGGYYPQTGAYYPPAPAAPQGAVPLVVNIMPGVSPKSRGIALLLAFLLGVLGVHRFYVGKVGTGLLYFFTGGLFGIGWLVDLIMIALGGFRDGRGLPLLNWEL